jgi:hypothetical protein
MNSAKLLWKRENHEILHSGAAFLSALMQQNDGF